jgi:hypothetical protein
VAAPDHEAVQDEGAAPDREVVPDGPVPQVAQGGVEVPVALGEEAAPDPQVSEAADPRVWAAPGPQVSAAPDPLASAAPGPPALELRFGKVAPASADPVLLAAPAGVPRADPVQAARAARVAGNHPVGEEPSRSPDGETPRRARPAPPDRGAGSDQYS